MLARQVPRRNAIAAGCLAVLFWGASFVWIKDALRELSPVPLLTLRFAIGTLVIWCVAWRTAPGRYALRRGEIWPLAGLGLLGVSAHQALQTVGMQTASATSASWLAALAPAFIVLLAWPMLGEGVNARQAIGMLAALLGAGLVSSASPSPSASEGALGGNLLLLASAAVWALYSILGKRLSSARPAIVTTAWGMTFGWVALSLVFVAQRGWEELAGVSLSTWLTLLLLGVASTGLAYGLYFYALSSAEAALGAALQYLEPLVTMALAAVVLGERPTPGMLAGGVLILVGVWLVDRAHARAAEMRARPPFPGGGQVQG